MPDEADEDALARDMIEVHGGEAAGVARASARTSAVFVTRPHATPTSQPGALNPTISASTPRTTTCAAHAITASLRTERTLPPYPRCTAKTRIHPAVRFSAESGGR